MSRSQKKVEIDAEHKKYVHELNINSEYPRLKYFVRDEDDKKSVIHFGQLKLLLTEIRFLTEYHKLSNIVVYAGAAPGHHIKYLSKLFPKHEFELYDPCEFDKELNNSHKYKMINCHQEYFTDKVATKLQNKYGDGKILFVSDIRTADYRQMNELENEQCIEKDNKWQLNWCRIMKPIKAMLKFRLPYPDRIKGPTQYLDGDIWIQSFARRSGTETRLIPSYNDGFKYDKMKIYDHIKYEEQLFFFNEKIRKARVENEYFDKSIGFVNNFDCWSYGYLLERYLFYVKEIAMDEIDDLFIKKKYVINMVNDISNHLGINEKWLLYKTNHKNDYFNNYAMMDHRHFHDLNANKKIENIPLPKQIRGRKRKYHQFMDNDNNDTSDNRNTLNNNNHRNNNKSYKKNLFDPVAFIKKIAKPFPNPDAWKDKINELIGDKLNDNKDKDENKKMDGLFKYLYGKHNEKQEKDKEDEKEETKETEKKEKSDTKKQLNNLNALFCINRLFVVLCIQIPPNSGLLNDTKFDKFNYLFYGLMDTKKIASILNKDINELYCYGILSHNDTDNKGNNNVWFKLLQIIGINKDFITKQATPKQNKLIDKINTKLLSINDQIVFTT